MGAPPGGAPAGRPPIPEAEIITRKSDISFLRSGVQPPAPLYIGPGETLFIQSWGSISTLRLLMSGSFLRTDGSVAIVRVEHTPNTDRSIAVTRVGLGEGFLLALFVDPEVIACRRGQCYVRAGVAHGITGLSQGTRILISDYVTDTDFIAWPSGVPRSSLEGPGMLRTIAGTNPAAGAEISETVPTNARWRLRAMQFNLTADANVANRRVVIQVDDGSNVLFQVQAQENQVASSTEGYHAAAWGTLVTTFGTIHQVSLPPDLMLFQGWRILTTTTNLQTGDNFTAPRMLVEEWIED